MAAISPKLPRFLTEEGFDFVTKWLQMSVPVQLPNYPTFSLKVRRSVQLFLPFSDTSTAEEGHVGEVSVQVDLYTHPGTGEHKVTVKGQFTMLTS